jgi:putative DNA primase/helicase
VHYGELDGIRAVNGLAKDWYEAYKRWCQLNGHRAAPLPKFLNALSRKRGTPSIRKRYLLGQTQHGPHAVLFMGGVDPPDGESETTWLGESIAGFREKLSRYKGSGVPA